MGVKTYYWCMLLVSCLLLLCMLLSMFANLMRDRCLTLSPTRHSHCPGRLQCGIRFWCNEKAVSPHSLGPDSSSENSFSLRNLARSHRLRISGASALTCTTGHDIGTVAKERDHIIVGILCRIFQNFKVHWNAEFPGTLDSPWLHFVSTF